MHKLIRCDKRKINRKFNFVMLILNIPSITAAAVLLIISVIILRLPEIPADFYKIFFTVLYAAVTYCFAVTLIASLIASIRIKGHEKYSYIEILGEQMIVSEYISTVHIDDGFYDYRRLWVINLNDTEEVICTRSKVVIKGKARKLEQRADWLDYSSQGGKVVFDYWWYNENGGTIIQKVEINDNYTYSERVAQRIIYCSQRQKKIAVKRAEFRQRMIELAGIKRKSRKRKPRERSFRGGEIERRF